MVIPAVPGVAGMAGMGPAAGAMPPALLALDWGTTGLRAFLMGGGQVLQERQVAEGIQQLAGDDPARFERALARIAGDWLGQWPGLPVMACGMIGSAQGWREAPYAVTPADPHSLGTQCVQVGMGSQAGATTVHIVPGVIHRPVQGAPDVMRGEETQVAGALLLDPRLAEQSLFVLPGTHSKWARVRDGRIVAFRTYMTGELYAVLRQHSLLGRLMREEAAASEAQRQEAFAAGVRVAQEAADGGLLHQLFSARTLGVAGGWPHAVLGDYLSGLLLGAELAGARACGDLVAGVPLVLVGSPALCERYERALALLGRPADARLENTAPRGLWAVASALGLVRGTAQAPR